MSEPLKSIKTYRDGMLHAAQICRNEFQQAPYAARDHDSVWMGGLKVIHD